MQSSFTVLTHPTRYRFYLAANTFTVNFSDAIFRISTYLDNEKTRTENKTTKRYVVLCIVSTLMKNFRVYSNEKILPEATRLRLFEQPLDDLLINTTNINFYDGESVSRSTKRMKIIMEDESEYDRRIDLVVKSKENEEQYDLCSNEFKKTVDNGKNVYLELLKADEKYKFVEVSNDIVDNCMTPPRNNVDHVKVILSPSKDSKRRKSVIPES
ncbi:hypothetical protein K501DRAFT_272101 [Backusella circina FSU 941]|nr:hypothetical protein K501DRAFT_272101 [Backusella circina FSU 941]